MDQRPPNGSTMGLRTNVDHREMKRLNTLLTLDLLYGARNVTLRQIVEGTNLSRRTVELIVMDLVEKGWVAETPIAAGHAGAGRPATQYYLRADRGLLMAIHIDIASMKAVVTDLRGEVLGQAVQLVGSLTHEPKNILAALSAVGRLALNSSGRPRADLRGGSIAVIGRVTDDGLAGREASSQSKGQYAPGQAASHEWGVEFVAENDLKLAALAEFWQGAARDHPNFIWLAAGKYMGSAIVIDGRFLRGVDGSAGEIVNIRGDDVRAVVAHPLGELASREASRRNAALGLVRAAQAGDASAMNLLQGFAGVLARLIQMMAWVIAPPLMVIGGGLEAAGDILISAIRFHLSAYGVPPIDLRYSTLGLDAPLLGAIHQATTTHKAAVFDMIAG
jgi:predicted NBD/HSP70 family sugar kinase